jgi:predicted glycosyltransferase involved in capsule biosynthesis
MIARRKRETIEITKFVACLPGYEDFDYKPVTYIHSWFGKKSKEDYKTERQWKKERLTAASSH